MGFLGIFWESGQIFTILWFLEIIPDKKFYSTLSSGAKIM